MVFKFEDNVPGVYVNESRDFQLLCRLLDIYLNGCQNRIANMTYQLDLDNCSEDLLWAIANKQGFTTKKYIPPEVLRNICKVFPYCIKNKGTKEAVRVAALAVLSIDRLISAISVYTSDEVSAEGGVGYATATDKSIYIATTVSGLYSSPYVQYLDELLTFILPAGWGATTYLIVRSDESADSSFVLSEEKVYAISTITGRIVNSVPVSASYSQGTSSEEYGHYSRIGLAKIIQVGSTGDLVAEKHTDPINSTSSEIIEVDTETGEKKLKVFGTHAQIITGGASDGE